MQAKHILVRGERYCLTVKFKIEIKKLGKGIILWHKEFTSGNSLVQMSGSLEAVLAERRGCFCGLFVCCLVAFLSSSNFISLDPDACRVLAEFCVPADFPGLALT